MSKRRRDSGKDTKGQPPPPPKPTKSSAASVFVDVTKADTQVLLVKVPAMLYDLWKETGATDLGTISWKDNKLQKRKIGKVTISDAVKGALSAETIVTTPVIFSISSDVPNGHRLMSESDTGSFAMLGEVKQAANVVPDDKDPAYNAYLKKIRDDEASVPRLTTTELKAKEISIRAPIGIAAIPAAPTFNEAEDRELEKRGFLGLFDVKEAWGRTELARILQKLPEATLVSNLQNYCEYVKAGEHHGKYILKPYLRNAAPARPTPSDEAMPHESTV